MTRSARGFLVCVAALACAMDASAADVVAPPSSTPAPVQVDVGRLPPSERAALAAVLEAARLMDAAYIRQVWPGTAALIAARSDARTPRADAERDALSFFKGPWTPAGAPFVAGVPDQRPPGDYYPADATKAEVEAWLASLPETQRKAALGPFTAIERAPGGGFRATPYGFRYHDLMAQAAAALRKGAAQTREPTLQRFLTLRAQALLDDEYYASDVAFVGLKGSIDVVLGPYEVDDDGWFGAKTSYEAVIGLVDDPATRRIAGVAGRLQDLENRLPLAPELRGRKLGAASPIVVLDAVYQGGFAAAGTAQAGYGLPNDLRVLNAVGGRTGTYSNILKLRYDSVFKPIAQAVLMPEDASRLRFEDIRDEIMFVRIFDPLGPQVVTGTQRPIAEALGENAAVSAQIRSMLLSLWGHRDLIAHGDLGASEAAPLYSAFLVPALARMRSGLGSSPSRGSAYVLNHLLDSGAISVRANGRFAIDAAAADADIAKAADEFISAMAKGDAAQVRSLLDRYGGVRPAVRAVLDRLGPPPPTQRPVYVTAARLSPPQKVIAAH